MGVAPAFLLDSCICQQNVLEVGNSLTILVKTLRLVRKLVNYHMIINSSLPGDVFCFLIFWEIAGVLLCKTLVYLPWFWLVRLCCRNPSHWGQLGSLKHWRLPLGKGGNLERRNAREHLGKLDVHKSMGPGQMNPWVLSELATSVWDHSQ